MSVRFGIVIGGCGSIGHRASARNRLSMREQRFDERRLAAVMRPHKGDVPDSLGYAGSHQNLRMFGYGAPRYKRVRMKGKAASTRGRGCLSLRVARGGCAKN